MLNGKTLAFGLPVLVVSAIAGQVIFGSKVTGDLVEAVYDSDPRAFVMVMPVDTGNGTAYNVVWNACDPDPLSPLRYCVSASGLLPKPAIKPQQVESSGLELNSSTFQNVYFGGGVDCRSGTCVPLPPGLPISVPLAGTFTIYGGPNSSVEQSNGSTRVDTVWPFGGITSSTTFSGNRVKYSANFAGIVGSITITPPPMGRNAFLTIKKGQQAYQTVYPPL